jgi:hypothetical protein
MNRIRLVGLGLMAVFAFSAMTAVAASAIEGPFYKVEGKTLKAGESRLLLATAKTNFVLAGGGNGLTCTGLTLPNAAHMQIFGAAAGNGGTSNEVIEFTGCKVSEGLTGCEVLNKKITTEPVLNLLGYASATRGGPALVLFEPEAGSRFVTVHFENKGAETCKFPEGVNVEGNVIGQAQVNGTPVGVPGGTETLHGEVLFEQKAIWIERAGALKEAKGKLTLFGLGAKLSGTALLLVNKIGGGPPLEWGVFS